MDSVDNKGYDDQELLMRALVKFVSPLINRSEQITSGLMQQSIAEWGGKKHISLKEIKHLSSPDREKAVSEILDIFIEKIKHVMGSKFQRDKLKSNVMSIYEKWKNTKRQPLDGE